MSFGFIGYHLIGGYLSGRCGMDDTNQDGAPLVEVDPVTITDEPDVVTEADPEEAVADEVDEPEADKPTEDMPQRGPHYGMGGAVGI